VLVILNCVPVNVKPVPAVYVPAPENCTHTIAVVPTTTFSVVCTQPVSAYVLPCWIKVKSPPDNSTLVSASVALVSTVPPVAQVYIPFHACVVSFLIRTRAPFVSDTPSIVLNAVPNVKVAPTPKMPLLYVTVPPDMVAKDAVDATRHGACTFNPAVAESTYCFVANCSGLVGSCVTVTLVNPAGVNDVPPRAIFVVPSVIELLVSALFGMLVNVFELPLMVLLVNV